jgi:hypothetical protein
MNVSPAILLTFVRSAYLSGDLDKPLLRQLGQSGHCIRVDLFAGTEVFA